MRRAGGRIGLAVVGLGAALALGACATPATAPPQPAAAQATTPSRPAPARPRVPPGSPVVVLRDIAFQPATVHVRPGRTVAFAWRDGDAPHNVTPVGRRRFRTLGTRESGLAQVRFTLRGTYRYVCTIHPGMAGRVVVR